MISDKEIKKIIKKYNLTKDSDVFSFIEDNPENLNILELSRIAELVNSERENTAAYYTDDNTLKVIFEELPNIDKKVIRVLEPSVGVGNFLQIIIDKYSYAEQLIIDVNDIDSHSIRIVELLNMYRDIPDNVVINYNVGDFLLNNLEHRYDLIIGNPPFSKVTVKKGLKFFAERYADHITNNLSGFFLQESLLLADYIVMIMPKYFLSNKDFEETRSRTSKYRIDKIIDFGEKGFKGVLIETIAIFIDTETNQKSKTKVYSVTLDLVNWIDQNKMTSDEFPSWLIYRNSYFDELALNLNFGIFDVFRDRQITNSVLSEDGNVRVLKSRNIKRDGSGIVDVDGYDAYIMKENIESLNVFKYYDRDDVYLCPNMTYYPRVIKKPKNTIVNGSVAILECREDINIGNEQIKFWSSPEFESFYRIARNRSTRSLNIDSNSVYFFGIKK